jgi:ribose 5-phosphate isomerase B
MSTQTLIDGQSVIPATGLRLKNELLPRLRAAGHDGVDFGACGVDPADDYPDFVIPLAEALAEERVERGIAICGQGGNRECYATR